MAISEVFTGERFVPDCTGEIWAEHWHRYLFATRFVGGKDVLDAACGEGYGAAWLARSAKSVSGLDVDTPTVDAARVKYRLPSLQFDVGSVAAMPYADASFDCAVSFETLEHLAEQEAMLREFRRVLRPDGLLIISTPNKSEYSDKRQFQNAFHVRELYAEEFRALLGRHFGAQRWMGQKLTFNSALWPLPAGSVPPQCEWVQPQDGDHTGTQPMYFVALAAARESLLPAVETMTLLADPDETMYGEYINTVDRSAALERLVAERDRQLAERGTLLSHAESLIARREALIAERDDQLSTLAERAAAMEKLIGERERVIVERDRQVSELVGEVARHGRIVAERDRQITAMADRSTIMERLIAERERVIVERDAQLDAGSARASTMERLLAERERLVSQRDGELEQVNARISLAEQLIAERERIIVERDAQLAVLSAKLGQRDERLALAERELGNCSARIAELEAEIVRRGGFRFWLRLPFTRMRALFTPRGIAPRHGEP
ncbi:MAG: methyltransferase domain-containing protein [Betaproteobacteria bacterium]